MVSYEHEYFRAVSMSLVSYLGGCPHVLLSEYGRDWVMMYFHTNVLKNRFMIIWRSPFPEKWRFQFCDKHPNLVFVRSRLSYNHGFCFISIKNDSSTVFHFSTQSAASVLLNFSSGVPPYISTKNFYGHMTSKFCKQLRFYMLWNDLCSLRKRNHMIMDVIWALQCRSW